MPTQLRVIERPDPDDHDLPFWKGPEGHEFSWWLSPEKWGLMWRTPEHDLPDERDPDVTRESWLIVLPNGAGVWNTTEHASLRDKPHGNQAGALWTVTGSSPNLTVSPSIDAGLYGWHGWIKNGEMTP